MIRLYDYPMSGNCYKVRPLAAFLGIELALIPVDFYPGRAHRDAAFLAINPLGQIPVLEDGDLRLRDAQAILVYLAAKYDGTRTWYPSHPETMGKIGMWLAFAERITATASAARLHDAMQYDFDIERCRAEAHAALQILDEHLWFAEAGGAAWIATNDHPTIADIACFPYIMLSEEGGISREDYPAIRRWTDRVKGIKGFITMPGIFPR
ncbi:MAG: glutathione S-transferase family protein [Betaproteobacteria bacterium]|nr:glutathione S-transferase family protein [Betaproteobacteria bacterium]